eukprot:scaffold70392_cov18-Tisochrysis_lutea.AAC.1
MTPTLVLKGRTQQSVLILEGRPWKGKLIGKTSPFFCRGAKGLNRPCGKGFHKHNFCQTVIWHASPLPNLTKTKLEQIEGWYKFGSSRIRR